MKIWTFTGVVKDQTSKKINTEESDRTHDIQNKHYTSSDSMKLQILVDQYVFAFNKPARTQRLFNVDIYKAIGSKVPFECIKGIQRCLRNRDSMFWLTFSTWPVWNVLPHYSPIWRFLGIGCRSGLLITSCILIHSYIIMLEIMSLAVKNVIK
jgi:hypothetical protein